MNWIRLNWIELNWIELDWIELNWIELNWIELNWIELDWIELNPGDIRIWNTRLKQEILRIQVRRVSSLHLSLPFSLLACHYHLSLLPLPPSSPFFLFFLPIFSSLFASTTLLTSLNHLTSLYTPLHPMRCYTGNLGAEFRVSVLVSVTIRYVTPLDSRHYLLLCCTRIEIVLNEIEWNEVGSIELKRNGMQWTVNLEEQEEHPMKSPVPTMFISNFTLLTTSL